MELFAFGFIGLLIGLIFLLIIGPFIIYGITKLLGFKKPSIKKSLLFWIIYLVISYSYDYLFHFIFKGVAPSGKETQDVVLAFVIFSMIIPIIDFSVLTVLAKSWFKENWGRSLGLAILTIIAESILMYIAVFLPILFISGLMYAK